MRENSPSGYEKHIRDGIAVALSARFAFCWFSIFLGSGVADELPSIYLVAEVSGLAELPQRRKNEDNEPLPPFRSPASLDGSYSAED